MLPPPTTLDMDQIKANSLTDKGVSYCNSGNYADSIKFFDDDLKIFTTHSGATKPRKLAATHLKKFFSRFSSTS